MTKLGLDFQLDANGDLLVEGNDLVLAEDVAQAVAIKLRWIKGEWFRDASLGIDYYQRESGDGGGKLQSMAVLLADIRENITSTPGIKALTAFSYTFENRKLSVLWEATRDDGELIGGTNAF